MSSPRVHAWVRDAMRPTPSASQFRAHAVRLARELLLSLAEQWNQFVTRSAPPALRVPPSRSSSLSFSLYISLTFCLIWHRDRRLAFLASTTYRLCLSLFDARCIAMTILSRAASFERFDLRGCAYIKSKVSFCSLRLPLLFEIRLLSKQARYDVVDRLSSFWDCLSCQFSMSRYW